MRQEEGEDVSSLFLLLFLLPLASSSLSSCFLLSLGSQGPLPREAFFFQVAWSSPFPVIYIFPIAFLSTKTCKQLATSKQTKTAKIKPKASQNQAQSKQKAIQKQSKKQKSKQSKSREKHAKSNHKSCQKACQKQTNNKTQQMQQKHKTMLAFGLILACIWLAFGLLLACVWLAFGLLALLDCCWPFACFCLFLLALLLAFGLFFNVFDCGSVRGREGRKGKNEKAGQELGEDRPRGR